MKKDQIQIISGDCKFTVPTEPESALCSEEKDRSETKWDDELDGSRVLVTQM